MNININSNKTNRFYKVLVWLQTIEIARKRSFIYFIFWFIPVSWLVYNSSFTSPSHVNLNQKDPCEIKKKNPSGGIQNTSQVSTYQINVVKCRGCIRSLFWCLLNKAAWDCSPSACGLSSRVRGFGVTHCTSGFFPPGPPHGSGESRLTNCKGFNWAAAHKQFSPHKGIGSNKCHKPIMR